MKRRMILVLMPFIATMLSGSVTAQTPGAAEKLETLKLQLIDVQAREESLRNRLQQLDYDLKPENIERALAGVGSTKPEELREERRRQLMIQRDGVAAELQTVELQRMRLENAIVSEEGRAYQESAEPPQSSSLMLKPSFIKSSSGKFWTAASLLVVIAAGLFFLFRRGIRS